MNPSQAVEAPQFRQSLLAGLETGIVGGVCVILYHLVGALASGEGAWSAPARIGAAAFGRRLFFEGAGTATLAGLSLIFTTAGLLGMAFGILVRRQWASRRVVLLGPLAALGWYYLLFEIVLRGPGASGTRRSLIMAHLLFGLVLAAYPKFLRALRRAAGEAA
jgi:hypothetical protein